MRRQNGFIHHDAKKGLNFSLSFLFWIIYISSTSLKVVSSQTVSLLEDVLCSEATELSIGSTIVGGTITFPSNVPSCSLESDYPGTWYKVVGNGNTLIVSTCSEATKVGTILNVFDGNCPNTNNNDEEEGTTDNNSNQSSLDCVYVDEMSSKDCLINNLSFTVSWESDVDTIYYILVSTDDIGEDIFGLHISQEAVPSQTVSLLEDVPCSDAEELSIGSTAIGGTLTFPSNVPSCSLESDYPGTWYKVVGNGNTLMASTCSDATKVGTILNVFDGNCPNSNNDEEGMDDNRSSLDCVFVNEMSSRDCLINNLSFSVSWTSHVGTVYYILVSTDDIGEDIFALHLTEEVHVSNDRCEGAISVPPDGIPTVGSTTLASSDYGQDTCGEFSDSRGIWYSVKAMSTETYVASTCNFETNYATAMSIFAESCESLECIRVSDFGVGRCGDTSTVSWDAFEGETYYILVQGFMTPSFGTFGLSISPKPVNDECQNSIGPVAPGRILLDGNTRGATVDNGIIPSCNTLSQVPAVWFLVEGNGRIMSASTCHEETFSDTKLSVLMVEDDNNDGDGCDMLTCVDDDTYFEECPGRFRTGTITWETKENQRYYVLVHTGNEDIDVDYITGTFAFSIDPIVDSDSPIEDDNETPTDDSDVPIDDVDTPTDGTGTPMDDSETPADDAGTPTDDSDTPTDDSDTTVDDSETPTDDTETPTDDSDIPVDDADTPTDDSDTPVDDADTQTDDSGTPTDDSDTPVDDAEQPTDDTETPTDDSDTPTDDSDTPVDDSDTPPDDSDATVDDSETPTDDSDTPADDSDTPTDDSDTPTDDSDTPADDSDTPTDDSDTATDDSDTPVDDAETPIDDSDTPTDDSDTPVDDADTPTDDSDEAVDDSETPTDDSDTPVDDSETPTDDSDAPTDDSDTPTDDSDTPVDDSETPTNDSDTPVDDTETPTDDSDTAVDGPETPTDDTEKPTDDSDTPTDDAETPTDDADTPVDDAETPTDDADTATDDSDTPTDDADTPATDSVCFSAIGPLPTTGEVTTGSTENANFYSGLFIDDDTSVSTFCGGVLVASPGVWYYVNGTGIGMKATTGTDETDFDTALSVFTIDDDDDGRCAEEGAAVGLRCMGANDNDFNYDRFDRVSTVAWSSQLDTRYYILVHGGSTSQDSGNFGLTITSFEVRSNDHCNDDSIPIPTDGQVVTSSTPLATIDSANGRLFHCGAFVGLGVGVWFRVLGSGGLLTASTCSVATNYNTAISVFTGNCGPHDDGIDSVFDTLSCIGGSDDDNSLSCADMYGTSSYTWQSVKEEPYHILVHQGWLAGIGEGFLPGYGNFGLWVRSSIPEDT